MTTLVSGEQTAAPNFEELDDNRVIALAHRGPPFADVQREFLQHAGSSKEAPVDIAAKYGVVGYASVRSMAQALLDADDNRRTLIRHAFALAKGEAARPDDPGLFLSQLRALSGAVPKKLLQELGLSAGASFALVAERLFERMVPKREAGR